MDAIDTTGAGDAFVAGVLSQLAADVSLLQVFRMIALICMEINHHIDYTWKALVLCC